MKRYLRPVGGLVALAVLGFVLAGVATGAAQSWVTSTSGGGHDPVTICHKPGTPAEHEITTDDSSVIQAHLAHGDTLGHCPGTTTTTTTTTEPTTTTTTTGTTTTGTTTTETTEPTTTETTTTTPPGDRCPPGMVPTAGKDGQPGNDECEVPPTTPETTTTSTPNDSTTISTETTPLPTTTESTPQSPPPGSSGQPTPKPTHPPKAHHPPRRSHPGNPKPPSHVCAPGGVETTPCGVQGSG